MEKLLRQMIDEMKFVRKEIKDLNKKNEAMQSKMINYTAALIQINKQILLNVVGGKNGDD